MAAKVLAAARLFAERGLDGATMSDIAEATGIPRATLYYYFEGKEAVFACMCGLVLDRFEEVLAAALAAAAPPRSGWGAWSGPSSASARSTRRPSWPCTWTSAGPRGAPR